MYLSSTSTIYTPGRLQAASHIVGPIPPLFLEETQCDPLVPRTHERTAPHHEEVGWKGLRASEREDITAQQAAQSIRFSAIFLIQDVVLLTIK